MSAKKGSEKKVSVGDDAEVPVNAIGVKNPLMIKPEQWQRVLDAISSGLTNIDACVVAGIAEDSFYTKLKKDPEYSESVKKAQIQFKFANIQKIRNDQSWQSAAWLLERKFKHEFGKVDTLDIIYPQIKIQVGDKETEDELKKLK